MATRHPARDIRPPKLLASPHHDDVFLVWGNELRLYAVATHVHDGPATLLHANIEGHARCVAWCPSPAQPFMVAVGTERGKVVLHDCTPATAASSYGGRPEQSHEGVCREFSPAAAHGSCNAVAWSEAYTNLVVAGYDRVRQASCVLVWDLESDRAPVASLSLGPEAAAPPAVTPAAGGAMPRAQSCAHLRGQSHMLGSSAVPASASVNAPLGRRLSSGAISTMLLRRGSAEVLASSPEEPASLSGELLAVAASFR
ncbi:hypothetical protein T492DRAFT_842261 [Pavlovales sp. CCMP2436]|nr:hypothetical protein T492DRAFT_842261 [Pavlovales sp. CCMP2436]